MRNGGVCIVLGLSYYAKRVVWGLVVQIGGVCVIWGLGYMNQGFWHRLGVRLCEIRVFVSFWGPAMRNEAVGIVSGFGYVK